MPARLPLTNFFHPRPVHAAGIAELRGPREDALRRWLLATREGVLVIHRTHCRLGKSSRADGRCTCFPSYLVLGACA